MRLTGFFSNFLKHFHPKSLFVKTKHVQLQAARRQRSKIWKCLVVAGTWQCVVFAISMATAHARMRCATITPPGPSRQRRSPSSNQCYKQHWRSCAQTTVGCRSVTLTKMQTSFFKSCESGMLELCPLSTSREDPILGAAVPLPSCQVPVYWMVICVRSHSWAQINRFQGSKRRHCPQVRRVDRWRTKKVLSFWSTGQVLQNIRLSRKRLGKLKWDGIAVNALLLRLLPW